MHQIKPKALKNGFAVEAAQFFSWSTHSYNYLVLYFLYLGSMDVIMVWCFTVMNPILFA